MQNKLPLEYGPKEAEILKSLTDVHKLPSKNEAFRRGIVAADYLVDIDRESMFEVLSLLLNNASSSAKDKYSNLLPQKLKACKMMACEVVAAFAVQKGIESADAVDIFRADIDDYLQLLKRKDLKDIDRDDLAKRLSLLSDIANQFAKKELESRSKSSYAVSINPSK
jgi:hypothetical protein